MDKKLTLSLDENTIDSAKNYAKSNNVSLSKLIESYLKTLTNQTKKQTNITPLVESLSGVISLDDSFDSKDAYTEYLMEKYKWTDYSLIQIL